MNINFLSAFWKLPFITFYILFYFYSLYFNNLLFYIYLFIYFWDDNCLSNVPPLKIICPSFSGHFSYFSIVLDSLSFSLMGFFSGFLQLLESLPVWKIINNASLYTKFVPFPFFYSSRRNLITCIMNLSLHFYSYSFFCLLLFFFPCVPPSGYFLWICLSSRWFSYSLICFSSFTVSNSSYWSFLRLSWQFPNIHQNCILGEHLDGQVG